MAWQEYDLSTVNPNLEPVGIGDYVFRLKGAKVMTSEGGDRLVVTGIVDTEGDFQGRSVQHSFFPGEYTGKFLKRLELALGVDAYPGETNEAYLNRAAAQGAKFKSAVTHRPNKNDAGNVFVGFNPWSFSPAV